MGNKRYRISRYEIRTFDKNINVLIFCAAVLNESGKSGIFVCMLMKQKLLELSAFIFSWCSPLIFLKCPDKITQIIKPIPVSNFRNRIIRSSQLKTCLFNPLSVQIIHRCLMSHFREKSAEIFR